MSDGSIVERRECRMNFWASYSCQPRSSKAARATERRGRGRMDGRRTRMMGGETRSAQLNGPSLALSARPNPTRRGQT